MNSVSHSVQWVEHPLGYFSFLPRLVRLCVFKFATLPFSTFYERFFLNRFHNQLAGFGFWGCKGNFSLSRAESLIQALQQLGGKPHFLVPKDREAKLQVIQLKCSDIKKQIEEKGGKWRKEGDQILIESPDRPSPIWEDYYENALKRIFPQEVVFLGKKALVTSEEASLVPFFSEGQKIQCILLARLGRSFVMNKFEIGYFLGKGIDVCVYDTRGTLNSLGYPTEGGLYQDIEAVSDFLFKKEGYHPSHTCIYGTCGESFTAIHLFKKYYSQGIHLMLQNAPLSLKAVVSKICKVAQWFFRWEEAYLQAPKNSRCSSPLEDGFDSLSKIESLPVRNGGSAFFFKTEKDTTSSEEEIEEMAKKLRSKGSSVQVVKNQIHEKMTSFEKADSHLSNSLKNPSLQKEILNYLFRG